MRIASGTLIGPKADATEALRSVADLVDRQIVVHPGVISDFSAARNTLLARGVTEGYDWMIVVDCDERIIVDGSVFRVGDKLWNLAGAPLTSYGLLDILNESGADILMVPHVSGSYEKERIFRLPAKGHYVGPTHEAWITDEGAKRETLTGLTFDEIAKTPEEYRAKVKRDEAILEDYVVAHPKDPRWWYYLADTYSGLGKTNDAIATFATCYRLNGWDEESAWAAYRAASLLAEQCAYTEAIEWCLRGMTRRADFPEFPWLAGWCAYKQGNYHQAVRWARIAIAVRFTPEERIGFRFPPAHHEGPWDVLRYAHRALGSTQNADYAEEQFVLEEQRRERGQPH